ncbi:MAG: FKBP-type peptidyl-prolyl cis-trans isomerase [Bacteroidetes bacterium]|nr:FKBP-type peptidyl-prolyl cis-trans isomerase [Bacteroidota bacterium]
MKKIALIIVLSAAVTLQVRAQDNFVKTPKGALVKKVTNNPGDKIKLNDVITFDVIQKTEKDSILFSTYAVGHAAKVQVQPSQNIGDIMDVFPLLAAQDTAYVKVPTDSIFIGHETERPAFLPKGSFLIYTLKIRRVQSLNDAMAERNKTIDSMRNAESVNAAKYIADNKLVLTTTPSGLKYAITQPSAKHKPLKGDTLFVNYTGMTLDGKVFDSSVESEAKKAGLNQPGRTYEPLKFVIGTDPIIEGWNEGLLLMPEGSKAILVIPSKLAYGDQGSGDAIPPFSTLVFNVELVKIKPTKHTAPAKPVAKKPVAKKHTTTTTKKKS